MPDQTFDHQRAGTLLVAGPLTGAAAQRFKVDFGGRRGYAVVDEDYEVVRDLTVFLRWYRLAKNRSPNSTAKYASALALYYSWCRDQGFVSTDGSVDWMLAADNLFDFMLQLEISPIVGARSSGQIRVNSTINGILTAVRRFYMYGRDVGFVDAGVVHLLYENADLDRPSRGGRPGPEMTARHRLPEDDGASRPEVITSEEFDALMSATTSWRDRLLLILMYEYGLRIGQALGLHRQDLHLSSTPVAGCPERGGPHLHVIRRENPNEALSKSKRQNVLGVTDALRLAYVEYRRERESYLGPSDRSSFVFVNLKNTPGKAMTLPNAYDVFDRLVRNAGTRKINPHLLRHTAATDARRGGASLQVIQQMLGQSRPESVMVYDHVGAQETADAVRRMRDWRRR